MDGIFVGVLDLYGALVTQEGTATAKPTYGAPFVIGHSIEVSLTPSYREGRLDASNARVRNKKLVDYYTVKANLDKIAHAVQKKILPRTTDGNGVQLVKGTTNPPKLAIGFAVTYDDGGKEFWWLYEGTFSEPSKTAKTDGEKIEYQTPTIEGVFLRRQYDNNLCAIADSENESIPAAVFTNWFTAVYEESGTATLDPDTLPIGAVVTVPALPVSGIDVTAVYVLLEADGAKAAGTMWRSLSGAWAQYSG